MQSNIRRLADEYLKKHIVRYFIMAVFVVGVELLAFVLINSGLGISYVIATPASMLVGIVLNWYFSKAFVFSGSRHKTHIEFGLVLITSLIGAVIQLLVTTLCVQYLHLIPVAGKSMAIIVTFFWNFWVRKKYIFTL